jgi:hypothetical protein
MMAHIAELNDTDDHIGCLTKCAIVVSVPPEVTDLDIALELCNMVYLPVVLSESLPSRKLGAFGKVTVYCSPLAQKRYAAITKNSVAYAVKAAAGTSTNSILARAR